MNTGSEMKMIENEIRNFLGKYVAVESLPSDANLFEFGFMSSLFAAQLIAFVENHFNIHIPDEDLEIRNFTTVAAIVNLINRLRAVTAANIY
jgi:methoxymalonate biosynthesis acyl carrier protein